MAIIFRDSAAKHGFSRADAIHAMSRPAMYTPRLNPTRVPRTPDPAAWIGPACDGTLIEVFGSIIPPDTLVIFHCMRARPKIINHIKEQS